MVRWVHMISKSVDLLTPSCMLSMGAVASSVLENGGKVLGVIPRVMTTKPTGHPTASDSTTHSTEGSGHQTLEVGGASQIQANLKTVVVETMHERKQTMSSASDGFIGLPGGFGTFEEVMEMITWSQLGIHNKPVVLVNTNGFWEPIRQMIDLAVRDGFISEKGRSLVRIVGKEGEDASVIAAQAIQQFGQELKQLGERGAGYWDWNKKPVTGDAVMADVNGDAPKAAKELAVTVPNLTFAFTKGGEPALEDCNLFLERGSRCLLIGANGAGKSTLLRILAGKRLCDSSVRIFGRDVFRDSPRGITYLGTEWAMNPVVRSDIVVSHFLDSVGGYRHKERRDRLLNILDVDLDWHMHQISDGERRRVQLCMGLMEPWDLLLLDEVTVDLDVQVRSDLLEFLMEETEARNATIICECSADSSIKSIVSNRTDDNRLRQMQPTSLTDFRRSRLTWYTCDLGRLPPKSRSPGRRRRIMRISSLLSPIAPSPMQAESPVMTSRPCCTSR